MSDSLTVVAVQRQTYHALIALANEIEDHQKKLDAAKLSFATTGAVGGIMAIVGLALTPVTFGASAGLAIAGGVVGGLSAAGNIGSLIADKVLTSNTMKEAQNQLIVLAHEEESVRQQLPALLAKLNGEELSQVIQRIRRSREMNDETRKTVLDWIKELKPHASLIGKTVSVVRATSDVVENVMTLSVALSKSMEAGKTVNAMASGVGAAANAANAGRAVATTADAGVDVAKTTAKVGLSGAKIAGIAAAGVGLAFDLGGIVYYSIKVHKQKPCDVAENIRRVANCLR